VSFPTVRVAAIQATPVILDADASVNKALGLLEEAAKDGVQLAVFPELFVPLYESGSWAHDAGSFGGWDELWERLWENSVDVPGPLTDRIATACAELTVHCAIGVNERESDRPGSLYNALLLFGPDGLLAKHRKLMPTMHERLFHGVGAGNDLTVTATPAGRIGGLICWENLMPLARAALYEDGVEIYLAPTADDSEEWHDSMRHIARESRAFVLSCCVFQRASSYPHDVPLAEGEELVGAGGSAILAPDGSYLAGPLWNEEGILYAELDPQQLYRARQRFDPAGHYSRPDLLRLEIASGAGP
jgi:nitrilase